MATESNIPTPPGKPTPTRAIARQATSSAAFVADPPEPDDPLLAFTPVPHVAPRRNSITPERQRAFIAQLAATGIVTQAARHIGASMEALYKLRNKAGGEEFAAAWETAADRAMARLEDCALARAIQGEERMVVSAGKVVGTEVRHNEALVMFFLRNRRGARHADDWRKIVPGHPVYEHIHGEIEARFAAQFAEREKALKAEYARKEKAMDDKWQKELQELNELEAEIEEERAELAAVAEGHLPPEQGAKSHLLFLLAQASVEELQEWVDWDALKKARKALARK